MIQRITALAELLIEQKSRVAVLEEDLKTAKELAARMETETLPELMREAGIIDFRLASGQRVSVKEDVHCGITEDHKFEAHRWLIDHGFGSFIKTAVTIEFGRGDVEQAESLAVRLNEDGLPATLDEKVHHATLKSFINEQLAQGKSVPFDLFGVLPYNIAKITKK
jgi:hypothetical protein